MNGKNWQFLFNLFLLCVFTGRGLNAADVQSTTDSGSDAFDEWLRFFRREISEGISFVQKTNISDSCKTRLLSYLHDLASTEPWAIQMWDSMDMLPAGIQQGNVFFWPGSYDECLQIQHAEVKPQYCLTDILMNNTKSIQDFHLYLPNSTVSIGICVPSACSVGEITTFLHSYLNQNAKVTSVRCQNASLQHLDSSAVIIIIILTLFTIVVILGTLLEVVPWLRVYTAEVLTEENEAAPKNFQQICASGLVCFSAYSNGRLLLSTDQRSGLIGCLHGLRFLSMAWIILLHTFSTSLNKTWNNINNLEKLKESFISQIILNGNVAVDTFYYISGLLVAYVFFKRVIISRTQYSWVFHYVHRYLRVTPVYAIIIGIVAGLLPFLGSGPRWLEVVEMSEFCKENWWLNLLYVSNIFKLDAICQPHCWFLAVDFQLYCIAPIILYFLFKNKKLGLGIAAAVFAGSVFTDALLTYFYDLPATSIIFSTDPMHKQIEYFHLIYMQVYCRGGPYVLGLMTGYVLSKNNEAPSFMNKKVAILGWIVATVLTLSVLFGFHEFISSGTSPSIAERCFYSALSRTAWAAGIAWIVFACKWGYGGPVDSLLSWRVFLPLGRLTNCAYILHYNMLIMFYASRQSTFSYDIWIVIFIYFGILISSYALSVPFCLMLELPVLKLEMLMLNIKPSILDERETSYEEASAEENAPIPLNERCEEENPNQGANE